MDAAPAWAESTKELQNFNGMPLALHTLTRLQMGGGVGQIMINANRNLSAYESFGASVWPDGLADYAGPGFNRWLAPPAPQRPQETDFCVRLGRYPTRCYVDLGPTGAFAARRLLGCRASKAASNARRAQGAISLTDSMASSGAL